MSGPTQSRVVSRHRHTHLTPTGVDQTHVTILQREQIDCSRVSVSREDDEVLLAFDGADGSGGVARLSAAEASHLGALLQQMSGEVSG